jgi:Xanthine and CO dehydrogenases maturation factor, XdhC/CoxF family
MNYYAELDKLVKKQSVNRIILLNDENLGEEAVYSPEGKLLIKTANYVEGATPSLTETVALRPELLLFGAGHVGKAVAKLASFLSLPVTVLDDREEMLKDSAFHKAERFSAPYSELLEREYSLNNPYYLIFTHGHEHDRDCLEYSLRHEGRYIGMIGSKSKVGLTYEAMRKKGFTDKDLERVHTPIGLSIGASTPEEIAISILAQIISVYSEKRRIILDSSILAALSRKEEEAVLVTIIESKGSSPRKTGASMLITKNGQLGTVGGGAIENDAIEVAARILRTDKTPLIKDYSLKPGADLGMACGGDNRLLFRYIK